MEQNYIISSSPHLRSKSSTSNIMWTVILCLLPAGAWGVYSFGLQSLLIILVSILASVATEGLTNVFLRKKNTLSDGSAVLTGILIGYNMPPAVPLFIPFLSSVFAIAVVKQTFGGLGRNWMNPALAGRVFALFCWSTDMTRWTRPGIGFMDLVLRRNLADGLTGATVDGWSGATPLTEGVSKFLAHSTYKDLFIGNIGGSIGEVSALLLLIGALILFIRKIITWEIPLSYVASFALFTWVFGGLRDGNGFFSGDVLFHLLAGGLILGAFFMATDMVTSPLTSSGMVIFGLGCGFFTFLIRFYGGFPEGVSLAIILMNCLVPLINQGTRPRRFGLVDKKGAEK